MKRKKKLFFKRIAAGFLAFFIILINSFSTVVLAQGLTPGNLEPGNLTPGNLTPGNLTPGNLTPGNLTPGNLTPGNLTPGNLTPGEFSPDQFKPGELSPGDNNPGGGGPSDPNSGIPPNIGGGQSQIPGIPSNDRDTNNGPGSPDAITPLPQDSGNSNYVTDPWYKTSKVIIKNIALGTINEFSQKANPNWFNWPKEWRKNVVNQMDWGKVSRKSFIAGVGAMITGTDEGSKSAQLLFDTYTGYDHYTAVKGWFKPIDEIKSAWNLAKAADSASDGLRGTAAFRSNLNAAKSIYGSITKLPNTLTTGLGGKITPWTAGASIIISGGEMISNFSAGETAKGIANIGEMLMSGSVVAASTGFGTPIAAGMAVAGGVIWVGAKLYQHRKAIGRFLKDPIKEGAKAAKAIVENVKNAAGAVKEGLSKLGGTISGWFK